VNLQPLGRFRRQSAGCLIVASVLFAAIGCQTQPPPPLAPPLATIRVDHFAGTPLSGPTAVAASPATAPSDALSVRVTFIALERVPDRVFDPLASRARLISSSRAGSPVLPSARLTENVGVLDLQNPADSIPKLTAARCGRLVAMNTLTGALPEGVTADFTALDPNTLTDTVTGRPTQRRVRIDVARPAGGGPLQLALGLYDFTPGAKPASAAGGSSQAGSSQAGSLQSERAVMDLPTVDHHYLMLVTPFRFAAAESRAIAAVVEITPGTDDDRHQEAFARAAADVRRSITAAAGRPGISSGDADAWTSVQAAMASLDMPGARRSALVFLATRTDAPWCEDVALVADDAALDRLAQETRKQLTSATTPQSDSAVGWALDHATLSMLTQLLNAANSSNAPRVPDELAAVLASRAGEAGRHSSSMEEVTKGLASREDLDNRLLAENLIFLEDSSPASRVRAFDWLGARGRAPAGYDPLGLPRERRQALERGLATAAGATTTAPTTAPAATAGGVP
jgi:hypothetical protein